MKKVLIISSFSLKREGMQVFRYTVEGFLRNNYKVILLSSSSYVKDNIKKVKDLFDSYKDNIEIIPFPSLYYYLINIFVKIKRFIFKVIRHKPNEKREIISINIKEKVPYYEEINPKVENLLDWLFIIIGIFKSLLIVFRDKPNVLYANEEGSVVASIIGKIFKIPVVTRFYGTVLFPILEDPWLIKKYPHRVRNLKAPADLTIITNDGTKGDQVFSKLNINRKLLFYLNGVNKELYIENFDKQKFLKQLDIDENSYVLLTVSRLELLKRVDRAIKLMPKILEKLPNTFLIIIGEGKEKESLIDLSKYLKVDKNILFLGSIPNSEVKFFMNSCDIFLSFYEYTNLANPVLEALESGACIVTLKDDSTKCLLFNNYNAILIPLEKLEEEGIDIIINLLKDEGKRLFLKNNALKTAREKLLSWKDRIDMEIKEIDNLIGK